MPGSNPPLIELRGVGRVYGGKGADAGHPSVTRALSDVSLQINAGEFVAIMGPSGSGKSTLMNILGCLDRPTEGVYKFRGRDVGQLDSDELARLRRESLGFVFQSYNLVASATARENVELPATYAGVERPSRKARAIALLEAFGLGHRLGHRPRALSGGEQQRVAVARALMNGGEVILADEPTGALDSKNGDEVLAVLRDLAARGHTVIIITHDPEVAARAERRIDLLDGRMVGDNATPSAHTPVPPPVPVPAEASVPSETGLRDMLRGFRGAIASFAANLLRGKRLRTALTTLSVTIGVWSVVAMLSVVDGAYQRGVQIMSRAGADEISVLPGRSSSEYRTRSARLTFEDAQAIAQEVDMVRAVLPAVNGYEILQRGDRRMNQWVEGIGAGAQSSTQWALERGVFFDERDSATLQPVVVIGATIRDELFLPSEEPVGDYLLIGSTPFQVKGVLARFARPGTSTVDYRDRRVLVPVRTALALLFGRQDLGSLTVLVKDPRRLGETLQEVEELLARRHGFLGFTIEGNLGAQIGFSRVERLLSALIGAVGAISLFVGGAGVASMMLVSLSERTREIGIRVAVGARQRDILHQFILEAVAITLAGGLLGTILGFASSFLVKAFVVSASFSYWIVFAALACALATGLLAGIAPARRAARLDPVTALSR